MDPIAWLAARPERPRALWWDLASGRFVAGAGAAAALRVPAPATTAEVERAIEDVVDDGHWLGGVRFAPHRAPAPEWSVFGAAWLFSPRVFLASDGARTSSGARAGRVHTGAGLSGEVSLVDDGAAYERRVRLGLERIAAGEVEKVVLARALHGPSPASIPAALSRMVASERTGTAFWLEPAPGVGFFGVTPERLYERRGARFHVDALAGTARVTGDRALDDAAAARLRADDKERREHGYVRDAVVSAVSPLSRALRYDDEPGVRRLSRVQHLYTAVDGELRAPAPLLAALHPTPAVCGTPRDAADALVDELEPFDRGLYAGVVGRWTRGEESLSVALRCARYDAGGVTAYAGAGVVEGSDPARERAEVERKASGLMDALRAPAREDAA
jgi:isochorismate synthase